MRAFQRVVVLLSSIVAAGGCGMPDPEGVYVDPDLIVDEDPEAWFHLQGVWQRLPYEVDDGERIVGGDILDPASAMPIAGMEHLLDDLDAPSEGDVETLEQSLWGRPTHGLWPGRVIKYRFIGNVPDKGKIRKAMRKWGAAGIRFVPWDGKGEHVRIQERKKRSGTLCSGDAHVGFYRGRATRMRISKDCDEGTILHELGHVIGLFHEHQRPDRDRYIKVLSRNIQGGGKKHYRKLRKGPNRVLGPYDYKSIMHYSDRVFAKKPHDADKPTMTKKNGKRLGKRNTKLSGKDKGKTRQLYVGVPTE